MHRFGVSFGLAMALHFSLLLLFGFSFDSEPEVKKQQPLPEIIQASVLDDEQVIQEAERLKQVEADQQRTKEKQQRELASQRAAEEKKLQQAREKRLQEEKKAKEIAEQRKQAEIKEQQKKAELQKQLAEEAARLAKIKQQQAEEQKRIQAQKEAEAKKREQEKLAEEKRKQEQLAKEKAEKVRQEALAKQQAEAAQAKAEQDRQSTITATAAIQRKVNNSWIRPMTVRKGLSCTIQVKLLASGDVMDATVVKSSGDTVFDRSAENAVRKASPLPIPKDRTLFARSFRTFTFVFKPE